MAIRLNINTNVEIMGSMMQIFHNSFGKYDLYVASTKEGSRPPLANDPCSTEIAEGVAPGAGGSCRRKQAKGLLLCSHDGDADRIIFHSFLPSPPPSSSFPGRQLELSDGDKIVALF